MRGTFGSASVDKRCMCARGATCRQCRDGGCVATVEVGELRAVTPTLCQCHGWIARHIPLQFVWYAQHIVDSYVFTNLRDARS